MKHHEFPYPVLLKYFCFYLMILIISILGTHYIINFELKSRFANLYRLQMENNLHHFSTSLSNQFNAIANVDYALSTNADVIYSHYSTDAYSQVVAQQELKKHIAGNGIIEDIIYMNLTDGQILSNYYVASENNGILTLKQAQTTLSFPYKQLIASGQYNTLLRIQDKDDSALIYIPSQSSPNYLSIFLINEKQLSNDINAIMLPTTATISLLSSENQVLISSNGIHTNSVIENLSSSEMVTYDCAFPNIKIAAILDNDMLSTMISQSFQKTYGLMLSLIAAGVICLILFIKYTYVPLFRFSQNIRSSSPVPSPSNKGDVDLNYIEHLFKDINTENQQLLHKIQNYRYAMQKSILTAAVQEGNPSTQMNTEEIDSLFLQDANYTYVVIHIQWTNSPVSQDISLQLKKFFYEKATCMLLSEQKKDSFYLLCYQEERIHSQEELLALLDSFQHQFACNIFSSEQSHSPMDIARLFESSLSHPKAMEQAVTLSFSDFDDDSCASDTSSIYPYQILDSIAMQIESMNFNEAKETIQTLFDTVDEAYPDFFIRCILLDTLTCIINSIHRLHMPFEHFSDTYYQTLYLCRSNSYLEHKQDIQSSFNVLLENLQTEMSHTLNKTSIIQYIEEHFCESTFSIVQLGEHFHVTGAYISYWFKKNMDINLVDYVWELRFSTSVELMLNSKLPIKDISLRVGYDNYSSFRRKFKDFTGLSPSEYRQKFSSKN